MSKHTDMLKQQILHKLDALSEKELRITLDVMAALNTDRTVSESLRAEFDQLKDNFIKSIGFETVTPLTAVEGSNRLLQQLLKDAEDEKVQAMLARQTEEIANLSEVIQGIRDVAALRGGVAGFEHDSLDLEELVRAQVDHWRAPMAAKNIEFKFHCGVDGLTVTGDRFWLSKVLFHLLRNARDYTLEEGKVDVWLKEKVGMAQVDIFDTGMGILEKDQPFIFRDFFRAIHHRLHFEISGAGLGLALSKAIIEAHGGEIWFESEPYQGSKFSFSLPISG